MYVIILIKISLAANFVQWWIPYQEDINSIWKTGLVKPPKVLFIALNFLAEDLDDIKEQLEENLAEERQRLFSLKVIRI